MRWHERVDGFACFEDESGVRLRCEMPDSLRGRFRAEFWARGPLMDRAEGRASIFAHDVCRMFDADAMLAPWQVHGTAIVEARRVWALPTLPKADGVHLDRSFCPSGGLAASLRSADCALVIIASPRPAPWSMVLHSGFHGTTKDILSAAAARAISYYGEIDMDDIYVWIGPSIGDCCYSRKNTDPSTQRAKMRWHIKNFKEHLCETTFDIKGEIVSQAHDLGINEDHIFVYPHCTSCRTDLFYSYRQGDLDGRIALAASLS